jgi:uncharacterized integral membrane protein
MTIVYFQLMASLTYISELWEGKFQNAFHESIFHFPPILVTLSSVIMNFIFGNFAMMAKVKQGRTQRELAV